MCLLLYKPADVEFSDAQLKDFHQNNPDGFGIMYVEDGKLVTHKRIGKLRKIRRMYRQYAAGRECALHFRWRTHGIISRENTHPFLVRDGLGLMHNGILSGYTDMAGIKSDTALLAEDLAEAERVSHGIVQRAPYVKALEDTIGYSNLLILLSPEAGYTIVNERMGRWHQGAWYSNDYAWDSPFGYSSGYASAYGKLWLAPIAKGSAEDWENDPRIASEDQDASVYELAMDYEEQEALDDLMAWLRATGGKRSRDYAVEMISGQYENSERVASFLWEIFDMALAEIETELGYEDDYEDEVAERVLARHEGYAG